MTKTRKKIDQLAGGSLVIIMSAMVINVLWQVITRFLGIPSSFTDELARYLMIWLGVLGAAYASGKKLHVAIDLISQRVSKKRLLIVKKTVNLLIIAFCFFALVIGGIRLVVLTLQLGQTSPALQIPLGWVYVIIPISGLLVIYYKLYELKNP